MPWELIAALLALLAAFSAAAGLSHPMPPPRRFSGAGSVGIQAALQARRQNARWIFLSMLFSATAAAIVFALAVTRAASG